MLYLKKKNMKFIAILFMTTYLSLSVAFGQDKSISSGEVVFHAIEKRDFSASSTNIQSQISLVTNSISIVVPVSSFKFKNAEMQKEFIQKENLNAGTYPNLLINGEISSNSDVSEEGRHIVTLNGELTIKGVTHKLETKGLLVNKSGETTLKMSFLTNGEAYGLDSGAYKDFINQLEFSIELIY